MNDCNPKFLCCPPETANVVPVQSVDGIKGLNNCFVYVQNINTSFYIDNAHRITQLCAMPIYQDNYDYQNNPLGLRSQTVYDFFNNRMIIYAPDGEYRLVKLEGDSNE